MGKPKADALFEGVGMTAHGLVGALWAAEEQGYEFQRLAGCSGGALVAALKAAGYSGLEIRTILEEFHFELFPRAGAAGGRWEAWVAAGLEEGIYDGAGLERWLERILQAKGVRTFEDLVWTDGGRRVGSRLVVLVSDLTTGRVLYLPDDGPLLGWVPRQIPVAFAVRASMSLPFLFDPVIVKGPPPGETTHWLLDGSLLSPYPVWLFDSESMPRWPTFGFKVVEPPKPGPQALGGPVSLGMALLRLLLEANARIYVKDPHFVRTIGIPSLGISGSDVYLSPRQCRDLFFAGVEAADRFFATWSFEAYRRKYRSGGVYAGRREHLWQAGSLNPVIPNLPDGQTTLGTVKPGERSRWEPDQLT